jgi:hypothetical protein
MTEIPLEFPLPEAAFERQRSVLAEQVAGRRATRRTRTRLIALAAAALVVAVASASAFGTVREVLRFVGKQPSGPYFNVLVTCTGRKGSVQLRLSPPLTADRSRFTPGTWKLTTDDDTDRYGFVKHGTGQYAQVTGGGRWRPDLVTRAGSKIHIRQLWGIIASGGQKQRVLITLEGGGVYTAPGRSNPRTFVLRPLEPGPLKADSGSQRSVGFG